MADQDESVEGRVGYRELIRNNTNFRNLWLGQVISELGDWFSIVALLNLLLELTGRAQIVGWFFIIIHLPAVVMGPLGGVLIDRLSRKRIMISMDIARAAIVLGYLLVRRADQVGWIYGIAAVEVAMMMLFEPARNAVLPSICARRELVAANTITSATWSAMLAIGAALGGFAAAAFGREWCFVLNSVSFTVSAYFIRRVNIPPRSDESTESPASTAPSGLNDIISGYRYIRAHPRVLALLMVKSGWSLGGGVLLILSIFGERIFPVMGSGAAGIGVLYAARGVGTGLGPIVARRLAGEAQPSLRRAIILGYFMGSVFYMVFGQAPLLSIAALALILAHMGGSVTWVFSTVLLQLEVPDEFRGRVFAIEFALMTLGIALSNYVAGYWLDILAWSPRTVATLLGLYFTIPGLCWLAAQRLYRQ